MVAILQFLKDWFEHRPREPHDKIQFDEARERHERAAEELDATKDELSRMLKRIETNASGVSRRCKKNSKRH